MASRKLPECWGHRGASAAYPENTLASFEAAIREGADGIESDVHVSRDDVVIMFHDPTLERTTNGKGWIKDKNWYGPDGMEHLRTIKEPHQPIPTFADTVALLMKPENQHMKLNVDVKVSNDPPRLFALMHKIISAQPAWEAALAPRIVLGLWHTHFVLHAREILPYCTMSHIGNDVCLARQFFWDNCVLFSMRFPLMASVEGQRFLRECKAAGKQVAVWTVNDRDEMVEAVRWGVDVILTDVPLTYLELRETLKKDYDRTVAQHSRMFLWTTLRFFYPFVLMRSLLTRFFMARIAGPMQRLPPARAEKAGKA